MKTRNRPLSICVFQVLDIPQGPAVQWFNGSMRDSPSTLGVGHIHNRTAEAAFKEHPLPPGDQRGDDGFLALSGRAPRLYVGILATTES